MVETERHCQISRQDFNRVTSHLSHDDPVDAIERDFMEDGLNVCR
ncbi:MAG: hypothetical protein V1837_07605 [Candidatus Woesearchaeota archaeon]